MAQTLLFHSPDHSPQPRIDFSYSEILICGLPHSNVLTEKCGWILCVKLVSVSAGFFQCKVLAAKIVDETSIISAMKFFSLYFERVDKKNAVAFYALSQFPFPLFFFSVQSFGSKNCWWIKRFDGKIKVEFYVLS